MKSYCPTCAAPVVAWPGELAICQHPGVDDWSASPVLTAAEPPPWVAERAAHRAYHEQVAVEAAADRRAYRPPEELRELRALFVACDEDIARALAIEPHEDDPMASMRRIGDALTDLTDGLREWHAEHARPDQRRVTPEAADALAEMVYGGDAA